MNAVIVGGTRGIGLALAQKLAADGHSLWVYGRNLPTDLPEGATFTALDVTANPGLPNLPQQVHALAYCVGSITLKPFQSLKDEHFLNDWNLNVRGAVHSLQAALPALRAAQGASVVLFSTVAVAQGMPYHASIAASKAAVEGLARSLAAEWAKLNIRVNVLAPSLTDTPLAANLLEGDAKQQAAAQRHPLGRYGRAEDLAEAAAFLLSPASSWITGQVLGVDGGLSRLRLL